MDRPLYVGIDVACGRGKPLPLCVATVEGGRLVPRPVPDALRSALPPGPGNVEVAHAAPFRAQAALVAAVLPQVAEALDGRIRRIAIDASATPAPPGGRASEAALGQAGLSVIRTPLTERWAAIRAAGAAHLRAGRGAATLPFANTIWMLYGFELFAALRRLPGVEVLETYPHAVMRTLLPAGPHKSTPEGYGRQLDAVAAATAWDAPGLEQRLHEAVPGRRDDRLDAFMATWVASLAPENRRAFGDPERWDDSIWVPRTPPDPG